MAARKIYNEGSTVVATVNHVGTDELPYVPVSIRYRVDSLSTKKQVLAWTAVETPSATVTLVIPAPLQVLDHTLSRDLRQIVVESTADDGKVTVKTIEYGVTNLQGVE